MKLFALDMEITSEKDGCFTHVVHYKGIHGTFDYHPEMRALQIPEDGEVNQLLERNRLQLMKILKTRKTVTYHPGFRLRFVITDLKDVSIFNDITKIILLDRRNGEDRITVTAAGKEPIHQLFTDASFLQKTGRSGIAAIIKYPDERYDLHAIGSHARGNCHAELEAVVAGLELLNEVSEIRIISDSRYVRKGLTEWMFNWKLNNWKTSNGNFAKNIQTWKKIDRLTQNKYIEVAWVKGHSGHFENTMCDLYAREAAEKTDLPSR